jgi:hypothetical protein
LSSQREQAEEYEQDEEEKEMVGNKEDDGIMEYDERPSFGWGSDFLPKESAESNNLHN